MASKFHEAWFNAEHVVLGRRLHEFCLNDALILSLVESPFLLGTSPGVSYAMTDLQLAVTVCSTPAQVFFNAQLGGSWWTRLKRVLWTRRCLKLDLELECQRFVTYVDDFNSPPDVWGSDGDRGDGSLTAPWILANATFLLRNTSLSEDRVWTMELGKALWYAATISEQLGSRIQILSEEESLAIEELQKS